MFEVQIINNVYFDEIFTFYFSYVTKNQLWYEQYRSINQSNQYTCNQITGIPNFIIPHAFPIVENLIKEEKSLSEPRIETLLSNGKFIVKEISTGIETMVDFGDSENFPSCSCDEWKHTPLPCYHMFQIFRSSPIFDYDSLSSLYRANPIFKFDECVLDNNSNQKPSPNLSALKLIPDSTLKIITPSSINRNTTNTRQSSQLDLYCDRKIRFPTRLKIENKNVKKSNTTKLPFQSLTVHNTERNTSIVSKLTSAKSPTSLTEFVMQLPEVPLKLLQKSTTTTTLKQKLHWTSNISKIISQTENYKETRIYNVREDNLRNIPTYRTPVVKNSSQQRKSHKSSKSKSVTNIKDPISSSTQNNISTATFPCLPVKKSSSRKRKSFPPSIKSKSEVEKEVFSSIPILPKKKRPSTQLKSNSKQKPQLKPSTSLKIKFPPNISRGKCEKRRKNGNNVIALPHPDTTNHRYQYPSYVEGFKQNSSVDTTTFPLIPDIEIKVEANCEDEPLHHQVGTWK